jgi:hypothetical protein
MTLNDPDRKNEPITDIHQEAARNLGYIRKAMEGASSFTGVPGKGQIAAGCTALIAAPVAYSQTTPGSWLTVWILELVVAGGIVGWAMLSKSRRTGHSLTAAPAQKTFLAMAPALIAGAVLTLMAVRSGDLSNLPGTWLLLYGAGVASAGVSSVRIIPVMGASFMICGLFTLLSPASWSDGFLALGFGALHILFGFRIAKHHGG